MSHKITVAMVEAGVNALANARKLSDEAIVSHIFQAMGAADRQEQARKKNDPAPPYVLQKWPSWRYGPKGESKLCESADDVPEGWGETPGERRGPGRPRRDTQEAA